MNSTRDAETKLQRAARMPWDAIVVGAGPAGSLVARQLASVGVTTLLIDAKHFPREKVCGGYLNPRALDVLQKTQLEQQVVPISSENHVSQLKLISGGRATCFRLPPGKVICRTTFDQALLDSARHAGAVVITGAKATVVPTICGSHRSVSVACEGNNATLEARVVISAEGLARTSLRQLPEFVPMTAKGSRMGIGAVIEGEFDACPAGQITMVLASYGYVGVSRIHSRQFNVAAAIDRDALLQATPSEIVCAMLAEAGVPTPSIVRQANWRGTPPLTSRPLRVAADRVLLIGDAGGYVEPFTGEGMAAALETATAAAPLIVEAVQGWVPSIASRWELIHRQLVRDRQATCRQLAWILRRPLAARIALNICRTVPTIAERVIARTSIPSKVSIPSGFHNS